MDPLRHDGEEMAQGRPVALPCQPLLATVPSLPLASSVHSPSSRRSAGQYAPYAQHIQQPEQHAIAPPQRRAGPLLQHALGLAYAHQPAQQAALHRGRRPAGADAEARDDAHGQRRGDALARRGEQGAQQREAAGLVEVARRGADEVEEAREGGRVEAVRVRVRGEARDERREGLGAGFSGELDGWARGSAHGGAMRWGEEQAHWRRFGR